MTAPTWDTLHMGAPTLLGGGSFAVDEPSAVFEQRTSFWRPRPDPAAFAILSAIVAECRRAGYQTTDVRRGKPDDVRCRCILSGGGYIEVILIAERDSGPARPFLLIAWAFSKPSRANGERSRVWQELYSVIDAVIQKRFGGQPLIPLSPSEIDARCAVTQDIG
jgi:hypothetical protein